MRYFISILGIFLFAFPASAKHLYLERDYQNYWCGQKGGVTEYKLPDKTRVDCLTDKYAVEFDFAPKWAECTGQAIYYGKQTNRTPACVLILENEKDVRYLKRLQSTVNGIDFKIWTMNPKEIKKDTPQSVNQIKN